MTRSFKIGLAFTALAALTVFIILVAGERHSAERNPESRVVIEVSVPLPQTAVNSPLVVSGRARGQWYFEATFPVVLVDWDGRIIAESYAAARGDWMTEDFVPFDARLDFVSPYRPGDPEFMSRGALILRRANPSGLTQNDAAIEVPITFR